MLSTELDTFSITFTLAKTLSMLVIAPATVSILLILLLTLSISVKWLVKLVSSVGISYFTTLISGVFEPVPGPIGAITEPPGVPGKPIAGIISKILS